MRVQILYILCFCIPIYMYGQDTLVSPDNNEYEYYIIKGDTIVRKNVEGI
jgi:hypothetical protein